MFGRAEVERYIPQRDPFLFVDEILQFEADRTALSVKRLSGEESFFAGHFPEQPIVPGVLLLEHMAQTANFLVAKSRDALVGQTSQIMVFGMVNRARFLRPVVPPVDLETEVAAVKLMSMGGIVDAVTRVDGEVVAQAKLQFGAVESNAA